MTIQILKSVAIHKTMVLRFIVRASEIRGHRFAGLAITDVVMQDVMRSNAGDATKKLDATFAQRRFGT